MFTLSAHPLASATAPRSAPPSRSWAIAVDSAIDLAPHLRPADHLRHCRQPAAPLTAALRADALLIAGSPTWVNSRVAFVQRTGLVSTPLIAIVPAASILDVCTIIAAGADEVLPSPFHPAVLAAKLLALTRRASGLRSSLSDIHLDPETCTICIGATAIRLQATPYRLLAYLVAYRNSWASKQRLLVDVFGLEHDPGTSLIRSHVYSIRRALGNYATCIRDDPRRFRGYMFAYP